MELPERIKLLRLKHSMSQRELGVRLNVSEVSIRNWENGVKKPSIIAIISMSNIFEVTTDYLLGVTIEPQKDDTLLSTQEQKLLINYRQLDKYGRKTVDALCALEKKRVMHQKCLEKEGNSDVRYGNTITRYIPKYTTPSAAGSSVPLDEDSFEIIPIDSTVPSGADFAVVIQGDSMSPYINNGDTVYVKRKCELSIGDVGIFSVNGAMYCKQYFIDCNRNLILVSANPDLRDTNVFISADSTDSVKCYGKVLIKHRIKLPNYISSSHISYNPAEE